MTVSATKKISLFIASIIAPLFITAGVSTPVSAYVLSHDISTTVEVTETNEAKVTQVHQLTWDNPNFLFPASKNYLYVYVFPAFTKQEETIGNRVKNLKVISKSTGTTLTTTKSVSDGALQVKIPYYDNLENGNDLEFVVTYTTDLYVQKEGGLVEISYPGLNKDFSTKVRHNSDGYDESTTYELKFILPAAVGELSSVYPEPLSKKTSGSRVTVAYNSQQITGSAVRITAGNERKVSFALTGKTFATNASAPNFVQDLLVNYIEVALPSSSEGTESSGQQVYYSRIEPFPIELRTDIDGNIIAKIPVSAVKDGEIHIEGYALIRKGKALSDAIKLVKIAEIPASMKQYLASESQYWQVTDSKVQEIAHKTVQQDPLEYGQLRKTLAYVSHNIKYARFDSTATLSRLGALNVINKKVGVCMEYSDLLLTLLRAQNIPTRVVFGDGVGTQVDKTLEGIGHQWVGVWFPNEGWVPVDPTWSDSGREFIGQDFDHFVWYVASKSVNEPSGFNCLSWDSKSPCKDALTIETKSVDSFSNPDKLMTIQSIRQQILSNQSSTNKVDGVIAQGLAFLGASQLGRILLSRQGMFILLGIAIYSVIVVITSALSKKMKKVKARE